VVAKPSAAIGNVTVDIVDIESIDLPEKEEGEQKVREFMTELHQPADIRTDPGDDEQEEESDEAQEQIPMKKKPGLRPGLQFDGLNQDAYGNGGQCGQDKAGKDVTNDAQRILYAFSRFHSYRKFNLSFE
jgi:hypothetical protein